MRLRFADPDTVGPMGWKVLASRVVDAIIASAFVAFARHSLSLFSPIDVPYPQARVAN